MANFDIIKEVSSDKEGYWRLCFQYGTYHYDDGTNESGYRFIWRDEENRLRPQRAQARIPSGQSLFKLLSLASKEGWFISIENLLHYEKI